MTTSQHIIRGCSVDAESGGYVIEFLTPVNDIRDNGLVLNHALLIPAEDPFTDLLEDLEASLQRALRGGLRLMSDSQPLNIPDLDDDDAPAPFDNPEER